MLSLEEKLFLEKIENNNLLVSDLLTLKKLFILNEKFLSTILLKSTNENDYSISLVLSLLLHQDLFNLCPIEELLYIEGLLKHKLNSNSLLIDKHNSSDSIIGEEVASIKLSALLTILETFILNDRNEELLDFSKIINIDTFPALHNKITNLLIKLSIYNAQSYILDLFKNRMVFTEVSINVDIIIDKAKLLSEDSLKYWFNVLCAREDKNIVKLYLYCKDSFICCADNYDFAVKKITIYDIDIRARLFSFKKNWYNLNEMYAGDFISTFETLSFMLNNNVKVEDYSHKFNRSTEKDVLHFLVFMIYWHTNYSGYSDRIAQISRTIFKSLSFTEIVTEFNSATLHIKIYLPNCFLNREFISLLNILSKKLVKLDLKSDLSKSLNVNNSSLNSANLKI